VGQGLNDLDFGGSCPFDHVRRAEPAGKGDNEIGSALGNHALIARGAVGSSRPMPFRQEVPFQDAVFPRPSPSNAIDAARSAVDKAGEWAASGMQAIQRAFDELGVAPIAPSADQDSQYHCPQLSSLSKIIS
jgi:hypothetical protein